MVVPVNDENVVVKVRQIFRIDFLSGPAALIQYPPAHR